MSFKLLAIRPLKDCHEDFLKNLEEGRIYKLYEEYEFYNESQKIDNYNFIIDRENILDVNKINFTPILPKNLYGEKINISAVVGKNGSGKSSLIELIYIAFYNLSIKGGLIKHIPVNHEKNLIHERQIEHLNIIIESLRQDLKKEIISDDELKDKERFLEYYSNLQTDQKKQIREGNLKRDIIERINLELFIHKSEKSEDKVKETLLILKFEQDKITVQEEELNKKFTNVPVEVNDTYNMSALFYNIIINYSFYGLNSTEVGDWIQNIFHKNDGYQTPIVLNPMKTDGIIDINRETSLTKQRFLYNLISNNTLLQVTQHNKIDVISLKLKNIELEDFFIWNVGESDNTNPFNVFETIILRAFYDYERITISDNKINRILIIYILDKIIKIKDTYEIYDGCELEYIKGFNAYKFTTDYDDFLETLNSDTSHITFKLKQALNFLFFNNLNELDQNIIYNHFLLKLESSYVVDEFTLDEFTFSELNYYDDLKSLDKYFKNKKANNLIMHLPPSIFNIDYKFENGSLFSRLSSGEKQNVYSINSILYHLINLNSAYDNNTINKYSYYNIILDEIELYSHPEMQRKFIYQLLDGINKLVIDNIKGINIVFITHSPFILSDIPKQNVLFLEVSKKIDENNSPILDKSGKEHFFSVSKEYKGDNTFGENIHQMLTDGFFITSTKGEFAISKINDFLDFYKKCSSINKDSKDYEIYKQEYSSKNFPLLISLIGEEYIRRILENHLEILEKLFETDSYKEKRISDLKAEIEKLENG
ncbi:hypothetical protein [Chryseobacterium sp. Mn2064]|uniref:hypothetical protein n=1 Tax=Chryseobacterium sp. Mn2064 TaxID=3395263 RepID=UPI003BE0C141